MQLIFGHDAGIYDAFNICVAAAHGRYLMFLGCSDTLAHRQVVDMVAERSSSGEAADVLYGGVLLDPGEGRAAREFDNRCFFGRRARLPWRNPCHHQGLIYRRDWLAERPFRTDIGPLADLEHNYQHRIFDIALLARPSRQRLPAGRRLDTAESAGVETPRPGGDGQLRAFPSARVWKTLSLAVLTARYLADRIRLARNAASLRTG